MTELGAGDLVIVYLTDQDQAKEFGGWRLKGKVVTRAREGHLWKVELLNTGSQDSEGYNAIITVPRQCVRKVRLRRRLWVPKEAFDKVAEVGADRILADDAGRWVVRIKPPTDPGMNPSGWVEFRETRKRED